MSSLPTRSRITRAASCSADALLPHSRSRPREHACCPHARPRTSLHPRPSATRTLTGTREHSHPWSARRPAARPRLSAPPGPARVAPLHSPPLERRAGLWVPRSPRHSLSALPRPMEGRGGELTGLGSAFSAARANRSAPRHPEPGRSRCGARSGSARGLRRNCAQPGGVALDGVGPGLEGVARAWGCVGPEPPPCPSRRLPPPPAWMHLAGRASPSWTGRRGCTVPAASSRAVPSGGPGSPLPGALRPRCLQCSELGEGALRWSRWGPRTEGL